MSWTGCHPVLAEIPDGTARERAAAMRCRIDELIAEMVGATAGFSDVWPGDAEAASSAANLTSYLALRAVDRRQLQLELAGLGLSSLGRCEAAVLANVSAVARALVALAGEDASRAADPFGAARFAAAPLSLARGQELVARRARCLLGAAPPDRAVRIMVTAPSELAEGPLLAAALIEAGMDMLRINCAHDDCEAWSRMASRVRTAATNAGRRCRILMDLAGPKARTGAIVPGPAVLHWNPQRNEVGRVVRPCRVAFVADSHAPEFEADAAIPTPGSFVDSLRPGDVVRFTDLRGKRRRFEIDEAHPGVAIASTEDTAWIGPETEFHSARRVACPVGLPRVPQVIELRVGDSILLTADPSPGSPVPRDGTGRALGPARIPFTLPSLFAGCRVGDRVRLDDGRFEGAIDQVDPDWIRVRITAARGGRGRLGTDKGVNLPDMRDADASLLSCLTVKDRGDLVDVVRLADVVGLSFVRTRDDFAALLDGLHELGGASSGIVLKIETRQAFENLPDLLMALLASPAAHTAVASGDSAGGGIGIMIARGDLAVECGWERLAEVQEEILWLCEAAHVPVIWATQVLETLAKRGVPSRSEITDAAMGVRAECVMLNKGPYVVHAAATLADVLRRMTAHQHKKRSMLRPLAVAQRSLHRATSSASVDVDRARGDGTSAVVAQVEPLNDA